MTWNVFKEDISKIFLSHLFELNPVEKVSKLMKSLSDFHDVTFNFLWPKLTDRTVVTLGNFSIISGKDISLLLETIEGRIIRLLFSISSLQTATKTSMFDKWWRHLRCLMMSVFFLYISSPFRLYILFMSEIYRKWENREIIRLWRKEKRKYVARPGFLLMGSARGADSEKYILITVFNTFWSTVDFLSWKWRHNHLDSSIFGSC